VPIDRWHATLADAILDRVIHNAYRIELACESNAQTPRARAIRLTGARQRAGRCGMCVASASLPVARTPTEPPSRQPSA
jgi:hypothetical protein